MIPESDPAGLAKLMKLEHWSVLSRAQWNLQPPEAEGLSLCGLVQGHPHHADGREVTTSPVIGLTAQRVVTRSGSEYELGQASPTYERLFPNARARLLAKLKHQAAQRAVQLCG